MNAYLDGSSPYVMCWRWMANDKNKWHSAAVKRGVNMILRNMRVQSVAANEKVDCYGVC